MKHVYLLNGHWQDGIPFVVNVLPDEINPACGSCSSAISYAANAVYLNQ